MRRELRAMLSLAWPVVIAEMGWIAMGIVDTMMVGPLGPAAIGAVGTGSILFLVIMMPGFGMLLALDTFVSQSFGAGRLDDCHRWLFAGLQLALVLTVVLTIAAFGGVRLLPAFGFHPDVLAEISPYMTHLIWSVAPLFAYVVFRRYLQAMNLVGVIMAALILANVVNVAVNWVLIYGRFGLPALGVVGAAYATVLSRVVMALFLLVALVVRERRKSGLHDVPFRWDPARMRAIVRLGAPAAGQILLEVGVFAAAGALAGRITPAAVAAHTIVLNVVGFIFMIPYGVSSAAAVRVGQAVGRQDAHGMRQAGWAAILISLAVMTFAAVLFATTPELLVRAFSSDPVVLRVGAALLLIAVVFQLFDGLQTVATGALRGLGNTHTPAVWNLAGHWLLGLPVAYYLCFVRGWGVEGLWTGLAVGIILVGAVLLYVWHRESTRGLKTASSSQRRPAV
jgi:MATE family multidrug resistance protein